LVHHVVSSALELEYPAPGMDYVPYLSLQGKIIVLLCGLGVLLIVCMMLLTIMCMRHRCVRKLLVAPVGWAPGVQS
jgi:hypothetical protein